MALTVTFAEEELVALYNALQVAEKYARGAKAKATAVAGMKVAVRHGFAWKSDADDPPREGR